jgi:hypothetical protein
VGNYDDPTLASPAPRRRRWPLVVALLALLLGGAIGYLVGARTGGDPAPTAAPPTTAVPAPRTSAPPSTPPAPPCLAAGQAGAAVVEQIEMGVQAIGALDPAALRAVLDRLQPLQAELEAAVASCSGRFGG